MKKRKVFDVFVLDDDDDDGDDDVKKRFLQGRLL